MLHVRLNWDEFDETNDKDEDGIDITEAAHAAKKDCDVDGRLDDGNGLNKESNSVDVDIGDVFF